MNATVCLLAAIADPDMTRLLAFTSEGEPIAKARARVTKTGHSYTPERTENAQEVVAWAFASSIGGAEPFTESLALAATFYLSNKRRCDTDNLLKLVLDAGTKARAWVDDSQIVALACRIEYDKARPRTEVALAPAGTSLDRSAPKRRPPTGGLKKRAQT